MRYPLSFSTALTNGDGHDQEVRPWSTHRNFSTAARPADSPQPARASTRSRWGGWSHKSTPVGSRSVDASWGTRWGWVGQKRRDHAIRGRDSARGTAVKALTRGPRHATSELHQDAISVTGGRGASRKVLFPPTHSPAKQATDTNVTSYPSGPFPAVRYSRLGCMHFDTPGAQSRPARVDCRLDAGQIQAPMCRLRVLLANRCG